MDGQIETPSILEHAQLSAYHNIYLLYGESWKTSFLAGSVYILPIERVGTPKYAYFNPADMRSLIPLHLPQKHSDWKRGIVSTTGYSEWQLKWLKWLPFPLEVLHSF